MIGMPLLSIQQINEIQVREHRELISNLLASFKLNVTHAQNLQN